MTKEKIEAQIAEYRKGWTRLDQEVNEIRKALEQKLTDRQATSGAIQALEIVLKNWEDKDDKAGKDTKGA